MSQRGDESVEQLAQLFREHPAWRRAARHLTPEASSAVYFSHRPGEAWRLEQAEGSARLLRGAATDPDFAFRFTPAAIERLAAVRGGIGEFAVTLFDLILEEDPELCVGFRIVADFRRLARRGYPRLLLAGGPVVLAFGARHGVRTPGALRRLVARVRRRGPEPWEEGGRDGA